MVAGLLIAGPAFADPVMLPGTGIAIEPPTSSFTVKDGKPILYGPNGLVTIEATVLTDEQFVELDALYRSLEESTDAFGARGVTVDRVDTADSEAGEIVMVHGTRKKDGIRYDFWAVNIDAARPVNFGINAPAEFGVSDAEIVALLSTVDVEAEWTPEDRLGELPFRYAVVIPFAVDEEKAPESVLFATPAQEASVHVRWGRFAEGQSAESVALAWGRPDTLIEDVPDESRAAEFNGAEAWYATYAFNDPYAAGTPKTLLEVWVVPDTAGRYLLVSSRRRVEVNPLILAARNEILATLEWVE